MHSCPNSNYVFLWDNFQRFACKSIDLTLNLCKCLTMNEFNLIMREKIVYDRVMIRCTKGVILVIFLFDSFRAEVK